MGLFSWVWLRLWGDRPFASLIGLVGSCSKLAKWHLLPVLLAVVLTGCTIPQVSAEERVFLPLTVDFLAAYHLPKQEFQGTPVGGLSAITYDRPRDRLYALSDDRSDLAPARFYTLKLSLDRRDPQTPRIQKVEVEKVTTITDATGQPFSKGSVDPEGIALSPQGRLFISSEGVTNQGIPPFIGEFERETGRWKRRLPIPDRYLPDATGKQQTRGVQDNLGFEALTLVASGTPEEPFRVFAATESALKQDQTPPDQAARSRLLHYLIQGDRTLLVSEQAYPVDPMPSGAIAMGLTDLLAIDPAGHFLSLERSYSILSGFGVQLYQIATGGALDVSTQDRLTAIAPGQLIRKKRLLDLNQLGIRLDNLEGLTLGPRLPDGSPSLILVSDDNFNPQQETQFLLFRLNGLG